MHPHCALLLTAAALAITACGTKVDPARIQASGGSTPTIDSARSYAWILEPATDTGRTNLDNNSQFLPIIQGEIDQALREKGFAKVPPGRSPDFKVAFATAIRDASGTVAHDRYFGGTTFASVPVSYTIVGAPSNTGSEETATIVIDARDPSSGDVLWRGAAGAGIDRDTDPAARDAKVAGLIRQLLATFPASRGTASP
ncbi:hypothetical protein BH23VER1_BH23VER1_15330 [soil metagenome]